MLYLVLMVLALLLMSFEVMAGVEFRSYQTHSHVAINVDSQTSTAVEKITEKNRFIGLRLKLTNSTNDGNSDLTGFKDERTRLVKFSKTRGVDGEDAEYEFYFTPQAVALGVEYFDYVTKTTGLVQLDYWVNKTAPVKTVKTVKTKPATSKKTPTAKIEVASKVTANVTTCGAPMRKGQDAFIYYKTWHVPFNYKKFFALETPDAKYKYPMVSLPVESKQKNFGTRNKEIAHYRLAHKLYKEKQFALVLRAFDFFKANFSRSPLLGELEFLKLNTLILLSRQLKTEHYDSTILDTMRHFILENAESEKSKATLAYIVGEMMEASQQYKVLEYALMGSEAKHYAKGDLSPWVFRLAVAECLYTVGEYDRAERAYQSVIDGNTTDGAMERSLASEAAYRIGEVYGARKFHERAAISYEYAMKKYPKEIERYPTNMFNLAESYFRLERYAEAQKYFLEFKKRFPNAIYTWAASMRTGELASGEASYKALVDVVNNHPYSIGAELAEARLAQCHRDSQSDPKAEFFTQFFARKNLSQLEDPILEPLEVELAYNLAELRFYMNGGAFAKALKFADIYRERVSKLPLGEVFKKLLNSAVNGYIIGLANEGNRGAEVLAESEKYSDLVVNPASIAYNLAIAKAGLQAGKIDILSKKLNDLAGLLSTCSASEKDEYYYYNAQLLRIKGAQADVVAMELNKISDSGTLSAFKLDELADLALLGKTGEQVRLDSTNIRSDLFKQLPSERQIAVFVRFLQGSLRQGRYEDVVKFAEQAGLRYGMESRFAKEMFVIRELRAEALYRSGDDKAAVSALAELIKELVKTDPGYRRRPEFEYEMAKSLARLGKESEALDKFRELARSSQESIWKKSAQAELDQIEWENGLTKSTN